MQPDPSVRPDDDDPLIVDLIGANQRLRDTLAMVFRGPAKGRCALATGTEARAVVVNLDGVGAEADWARYRERHPDRPAIVLALDEQPRPHAVAVVAKPVRIDKFLAAIDSVHSRLCEGRSTRDPTPATRPSTLPTPRPVTAPASPSVAPTTSQPACTDGHARDSDTTDERTEAMRPRAVERDRWERLCGGAPDCDLDDPLLAAGRRFAGSTRVLDCLRSAFESSRRDGTPRSVRLRGLPIVTLQADRSWAVCALSDDQLAALCGAPVDDGLLDVGIAGPTEIPPATSPFTLDALLWQCALWTYRGQIPAGTALDQRMYLSHWPNLTRLMPVPNATRIAALLVRHPMRLARVAEALAIPQRHVFAFFVAASAIGLMGVARRETDSLVEQTPPEPHSRRSLLERIARNLPRDIVPRAGNAP